MYFVVCGAKNSNLTFSIINANAYPHWWNHNFSYLALPKTTLFILLYHPLIPSSQQPQVQMQRFNGYYQHP